MDRSTEARVSLPLICNEHRPGDDIERLTVSSEGLNQVGAPVTRQHITDSRRYADSHTASTTSDHLFQHTVLRQAARGDLLQLLATTVRRPGVVTTGNRRPLAAGGSRTVRADSLGRYVSRTSKIEGFLRVQLLSVHFELGLPSQGTWSFQSALLHDCAINATWAQSVLGPAATRYHGHNQHL